MNKQQDIQSQELNTAELRNLTADEVLGVSGGPQVLNDGPALIANEDLSAISGGPQVINDLPT